MSVTLVLGSNVIRNTLAILEVDGKNQIELEIGREEPQLLLTADIYDGSGKHVAKLRRNAWAFNLEDRYSVDTNPESLALTDRVSGKVLIHASVSGLNTITVDRADFFTPAGKRILIEPDCLRIDGLTMSGNTFNHVGRAITIDSERGVVGLGATL